MTSKHTDLNLHGDWPTPVLWADPAEEVKALEGGWWRPTNQDFDALLPNSRVLTNEDALWDILATSKVQRINLYSHVISVSANEQGLAISGSIEPQGGIGSTERDTITFNQVQSFTGVNKAHRLSTEDPFSRELWIYNCGGVLEEDMLYLLATFIGRRVLAFPSPIWLFAEFKPPDKIGKRGRIDIVDAPSFASARPKSHTEVDPYKLDRYSKLYQPYT